MRVKTVVFDLDGTLADTSGDLIAAANACFQDMGVGDMLDQERDAGTALRGGRAMLRLGMGRLGRVEDEATIDAYYPKLLAAYAQDIDSRTVMYPGAMDAVAVLKSAGYRTAICTNKPEAPALDICAALGISQYFDVIAGARRSEVLRRRNDGHALRLASRDLVRTRPCCAFSHRPISGQRPSRPGHRSKTWHAPPDMRHPTFARAPRLRFSRPTFSNTSWPAPDHPT